MTPTPPFDLIVLRSDAVAVVQVLGDVDMHTGPMLRERLADLIAGGVREITLDMGGLTFIDSTGLTVLVSALRQIREVGGDLTVRALPRSTLRVFEITGLTEVFAIAGPNPAEAHGQAREIR